MKNTSIIASYCLHLFTFFNYCSTLLVASEASFLTIPSPLTTSCCHRRNNPSLLSSPRASSSPSASSTSLLSYSNNNKSFADIEEITTFAMNNGVKLSFTVRGPGYRGTATSSSLTTNNDESIPILGYVEGFIRPGGKILHVDRMEIFNSKQKMGGTFLGPGLLIAYICLLHGYESGCKTCEFLAIDDAEYQHKRLVKYYGSAGFKSVRYVGENLRDIPDRVVWGGCGTLMTQDITVVLEKWTRIIRKASSSSDTTSSSSFASANSSVGGGEEGR